MENIIQVRLKYYIVSLWGIYTIYLALFGNLLLFPRDGFELIIPAILQSIMVIAFNRLFKVKYIDTISLTALSCCVLLILWHFNLNHGIPRKLVIMLFLVLPIFSTAITYFMGEIKKSVPIPVLKHFGVSLLLTFANFIIAIVSFYIFHYWI